MLTDQCQSIDGVGKNRYAIHVYVWREIMAHVTAGLALPKASSNDSDVATKSHVLLNCPREGGLYFLDTVVEHVASLARADLIRIDPQDLEEMAGDFLGDTKYCTYIKRPYSYLLVGESITNGNQSSG